MNVIIKYWNEMSMGSVAVIVLIISIIITSLFFTVACLGLRFWNDYKRGKELIENFNYRVSELELEYKIRYKSFRTALINYVRENKWDDPEIIKMMLEYEKQESLAVKAKVSAEIRAINAEEQVAALREKYDSLEGRYLQLKKRSKKGDA